MTRTRAVRPFEWAFPPRPARRELLSMLPEVDTGKPPLLFVHGLAHGAWCFAEHWLPAAAEHGFPAYAVSGASRMANAASAAMRTRTLPRALM